MRKLLVFSATLLITQACAKPAAPPTPAISYPDAQSLRIYRIVAESLYVHTTKRPVAIAAMTLDTACAELECAPLLHRWAIEDPFWWTAGDTAEAKTVRDDMMKRSRVRLDLRTVPFGEQMLTVTDASDIPDPAADKSRWIKFRDSHFGAAGALEFSPIGFSSSGNEAIVFVDWRCGPTCGHKLSVYLRKQAEPNWGIADILLMSSVSGSERAAPFGSNRLY